MSITPAGLIFALNVKGFNDWDGRTKALVGLVAAVLAIVVCVGLVRRVGWPALLVPAVLIGALALMNRNAGCLEHAGDLKDLKTTGK